MKSLKIDTLTLGQNYQYHIKESAFVLIAKCLKIKDKFQHKTDRKTRHAGKENFIFSKNINFILTF